VVCEAGRSGGSASESWKDVERAPGDWEERDEQPGTASEVRPSTSSEAASSANRETGWSTMTSRERSEVARNPGDWRVRMLRSPRKWERRK